MKSDFCTHRKKRALILILSLLPFFLTGCWSSVEMHDIAFINAMAVDLNKTGDYEITVVMSNPSAIFSQSFVGKTGGSQQNMYLIQSAEGKSIFDAVGVISHSLPEKMYFGHMDAVIFGEKVAKEKMTQSLDYFYRETQFRPNIKLLVAKGKAAKMIANSPELNTTLGLTVLDFTKPNRYATSTKIKDISQFMKDYSSTASDAVTAVLTTSDKLGVKAKAPRQESKNKQLKDPKATSIDGIAVFKGESLKGFFNQKETHGVSWIKGEMRNEIVTLSCGQTDDGVISAVVRENNSQFYPHIDEKGKKLTIKMNVKAEIGEVACSNFDLSSKNIESLNSQLEKYIIKEVNLALDKAQNLWETDIFGFGKAFYREYPLEWKKMKPTWRNGGLKELQVSVKVNANLTRFGLRKNPENRGETR